MPFSLSDFSVFRAVRIRRDKRSPCFSISSSNSWIFLASWRWRLTYLSKVLAANSMACRRLSWVLAFLRYDLWTFLLKDSFFGANELLRTRPRGRFWLLLRQDPFAWQRTTHPFDPDASRHVAWKIWAGLFHGKIPWFRKSSSHKIPYWNINLLTRFWEK